MAAAAAAAAAETVAAAAAAAEAREILKPTKYHGKSFQSLIVFHEILKTAPRRSHAIHFRYGSKSGSYCCFRVAGMSKHLVGQAYVL